MSWTLQWKISTPTKQPKERIQTKISFSTKFLVTSRTCINWYGCFFDSYKLCWSLRSDIIIFTLMKTEESSQNPQFFCSVICLVSFRRDKWQTDWSNLFFVYWCVYNFFQSLLTSKLSASVSDLFFKLIWKCFMFEKTHRKFKYFSFS